MSVYNELQPNTSLCGGKYIIEKKIGDGGFGIAYRAVQTVLNRVVCIKEYYLSGYCVRDPQYGTVHPQGIDVEFFEKYRASFVREAQILAKLHHPGVVEVIDIFDENNTSYMVMPFIEGPSLQSIVEKNGPMSYPDAVNYMAQIASAVGYIHDRHILHRDIKPDNILITSDYKAVLIDFGSAREFIEDKTQAYTSMVSHGYAPTEQYTRTSRKGSYSDIYSLGATLYFILTGRVPLEAAARLTEELVEPQKLNSTIPPEGNRTILKAMNLKKEERYQSVRDFMDDLRNKNYETKSKILTSEKRTSVRYPKRNSLLIWLMVLTIVSLVSVLTVKVIQNQRKVKLMEQQQLIKLDSTYLDALNEFDSCLQQFNDATNLSDLAPMMGAWEALKKIEDVEKQPIFNKLGKKQSIFEITKIYEQKVIEENSAVAAKLAYLKNEGLDDGTLYQQLQIKQIKCDSMLYIINSKSESDVDNVKNENE